MSETDDLRRAMRHQQPQSRREKRAAKTRARVLSPSRIVMSLLSLPLLAGSVAVSLYIRTSPYEPTEAVLHLVARAGCDAARRFGLAPAYRGQLGYHARNDADGDGVACESKYQFSSTPVAAAKPATAAPEREKPDRMVGGAKFVKP